MNRPFKVRFFIIILTVLVGVVFLVKQSFAYFDHLQLQDKPSIPIGEWSNALTKEKVVEHIKQKFPPQYHRYILDGLGTYDRDITNIQDLETLYEAFILSEKYLDYSTNDVLTMIHEMWDTGVNFLDFPNNVSHIYATPSYPTNNRNVELVQIEEFTSLQKGHSKQVVKVINTANLPNVDDQYVPIILQVVLSSKIAGQDISDYLLEVFMDSTFLTRFSTGYIIYSDASLNYPYVSRSQFIVQNLHQYTISSDIDNLLSLIRVKYTTSSPLMTYLHSYPKPQATGQWMRFPEGLRYDLVADSYWKYFPQQISSSEPGVVINGRPDGVHTDLRILFAHRYMVSDVRTANIPLTFVLSRADGGPVGNNEIIVRYRFVYSSDSHWDHNLRL